MLEDPSGRRLRRLRWVGRSVALLCFVWLAVIVVGALGVGPSGRVFGDVFGESAPPPPRERPNPQRPHHLARVSVVRTASVVPARPTTPAVKAPGAGGGSSTSVSGRVTHPTTAPGNSGSAPGHQPSSSPGRSGSAPGHQPKTAHGNSASAPGHQPNTAHGNSASAPGHQPKTSHGNSGSAPGQLKKQQGNKHTATP